MDHTARPSVAIICGLIVRMKAATMQSSRGDSASTPEQAVHLTIAADFRCPYQVNNTNAIGSEVQQIGFIGYTPTPSSFRFNQFFISLFICQVLTFGGAP